MPVLKAQHEMKAETCFQIPILVVVIPAHSLCQTLVTGKLSSFGVESLKRLLGILM